MVGISNWALDPAKMNRAVHLYRPAPTVADLSATAEGMVRGAGLKAYLQAIAKAYSATYRTQSQQDFWGLREFYSTVKHINARLNPTPSGPASAAASGPASAASATSGPAAGPAPRELDGALVMQAVQRNFGGRPKEMEGVLRTFFSQLGMATELGRTRRLSVLELVRQNLDATAQSARYLMLLTRHGAALSLLFDRGVLDHKHSEVIIGSDFPLDQTDLHVCLNIQRVKLCMAEGRTVCLYHCESLFESLYDLLNQHYTEYGGPWGGAARQVLGGVGQVRCRRGRGAARLPRG